MVLRYPPGPANFNAWFGLTWRHAFLQSRQPLKFVTDLAEKYGDIVFLRLFNYCAYQINHPDLIREVLVTKAQSFIKQTRQMDVIRPITGTGLLTEEGELWKRQRRIMMPAFQSRDAARTAEIAVAKLRAWADSRHEGQCVELSAEMNKCMIRVVSEALFDAKSDEQADEFGDAMNAISQTVLEQISWIVTLPEWVPGSSQWRRRQARDLLHKHIDAAIVRRRAQPSSRKDLLDLLLSAVDAEGDGRHMSDAQARSEAVTMFFAGHHTAAATLTWSLYLLSQNRAVEERLMDEIDSVLGDRPAAPDDVPKLKYAEQVIKEAMRVYPPAWALFARQAVEDVEIGGYTIPKDAWIFIYPWVVHRDARFFPEPLKFDPDRFAEPHCETIPSGAYIPFGLGGHTCLGNRVAMSVLTLALPTILQRFQLTLAPGQPTPVPEPLISIRPKNDIRMVVKARRDVANPA
jgi:cytochrome P450